MTKKTKTGRKHTKAGSELIEAATEALAHVRGEIKLKSKVLNPPSKVDVKVIRSRFKLSQQGFANRFGFKFRTVQDWESGRRQPEGAARILLKVIEKRPDIVQDVLE